MREPGWRGAWARHGWIGDGIGIPQSIGETMTEQHDLRVRDLFAQAADLPRQERDDFLDAACRGDAALRAEVEGLLAYDSRFGADADEDGFLKSPLVRAPRQRCPGLRYGR